MSDAALNFPHLSREDPYLDALEAFLRTSAGYLDVEAPAPGRGFSGDCCEHAV